MPNPFSKTPPSLELADGVKVEPGDLPFKETRFAFEYACQFMNWLPIEACQPMMAIIEDGREVAEIMLPVRVEENGNQIASVRYGKKGGSGMGIGFSISPNGPRLVPGQLVMWQPIPSPLGTPPGFAGGMILGTLHPVWSPKIGWRGDERFV